MLKRLVITLASVGIAICALAGSAGAGADTPKSSKAHKAHKAGRRGRCTRRQRRHGRCGSHAKAKLVADPVGTLPSSTTAHVETWAFDDGCNGGAGAGAALVRKWLTFAESNCGPKSTQARTNCHSGGTVYCRVMQYLDTDWEYAGESGNIASAASATWWLHEPQPTRGVRIYSNYLGNAYLVNQSNSGVRSFFRSYVRRHYNSDDGLLMDWQSPGLSQELYYSTCGCSTTSEIRSDAALRTTHEQMAAALTHTSGAPFVQVNNTLPPNPWVPQGLDMLNHSTGVDGWVAEGLPEDGGTLDPYYSTLLDQIAYVANRTTGFVVPMSRAPAGASYQLQTRRVQEATIFLGYSPGHLVDWADLEQGSQNLSVWPEEGIYPTAPMQSMRAPGGRGCLAGTGKECSTGGHNDVRVKPGVYRREFGACYRNGVLFGACAAVINTTGSSVTVQSSWLKRSYRHQITFIGGDVQSRGAIALTGAPFRAGSTAVGAHDALLVAR